MAERAQGSARVGQHMTRRAFAAGAAGSAAGGLLAACAGSGPSTTDQVAAPFKGSATIRFTTVFPDQPITSVIQQQVDRFAKQTPQITVKFEPAASTSDWLEKRKIEAAAGDAVDLSHHRANAMGELASLGILEELGAYIKRDGKALRLDDYWPGATEAGAWRGKQVGLVYRGFTVQGVIFSVKLFQQAGQPTPLEWHAKGQWTWQKLRELAKPLTSKVDDPNPGNRIFGTSTWIIGSWFTAAVPLASFGHDILTKDRKQLAPTTPQATDAVQFFQDLACKDRSAPARDTDGYEFAADGHMNTGRLGMAAQSTDNLLRLRQFGWPFDIAPMPKDKQQSSLLNAEQICLLHYGKQKDGAWEYLKFAASPDEQAIMAKAFGQTPPYKSQFDAWAKTADATQGLKGAPLIADVLKYAKPLPIELTIKFSDLQSLWEQKIIGAPLLNQCGGRSAKDAYDQFVRDGNAVMGQITW